MPVILYSSETSALKQEENAATRPDFLLKNLLKCTRCRTLSGRWEGKNMRILIVDDEDVALNSVKRLLKWRGIRSVDVCNSGKEAIIRIRETDFDIVLLDLLMPEVDGLQVLEATKPYRPHTEFIILTAIDDIPTTVKAIRLGAYDYLVKPVDNDLLFLSIKRAYEHRGLLIGLSVSAQENKIEVPEAFNEIITQCPGCFRCFLTRRSWPPVEIPL